jgi:hypothetical protein
MKSGASSLGCVGWQCGGRERLLREFFHPSADDNRAILSAAQNCLVAIVEFLYETNGFTRRLTTTAVTWRSLISFCRSLV